jgi:phosphohistidine phosphatase
MELYLIRHGIAIEQGLLPRDEDRPLTDRGREKTAKVAQRLRSLGIHFDAIIASPLVRAQQTAEILQAGELGDRLETSPHLAPDGDIRAWVEQWQKSRYNNENSCLALVGHQPDLGLWAEMLIWGKAEEKLILKKSGAIGLNVPAIADPIGQCELFLLASPKWMLANF